MLISTYFLKIHNNVEEMSFDNDSNLWMDNDHQHHKNQVLNCVFLCIYSFYTVKQICVYKHVCINVYSYIYITNNEIYSDNIEGEKNYRKNKF